jgi:exosortase
LRAFEWGLIAALGVVFAPGIGNLAGVWSSVDYYSHGYLVPVAALIAALGLRGKLAAAPAERDGRGAVLLVLAVVGYWLGFTSGVVSLQGAALVVAVAALVLYLRGPRWLAIASFPVGYLGFMVPLPDAWLTPVIVRLQLFVSQAGVWILQVFRFPVYRDGNVIELPGGQSLFVAEACSGITSIVTLLPLAALLAWYTQPTLVRRLLLVAAVVPLAMLGNLVRVLGTILTARGYGATLATEGVVHDSAGILSYVLGCLALLFVSSLIRRLGPSGYPRTTG